MFFYIIFFATKYLFINYFSNINFISGYLNQIYLFIVSLTNSTLAMVNFATNILIILILAIIISFMFILTIINFCVISFAINYLFIGDFSHIKFIHG